MINKKKKKGFTIVELVIVIVIVGVLAAVLIPTFGSLIRQANESADKQTVYQMNIILAAELIDESLEGDALLAKVKEILKANDIDVDNLSPASDDLKFMWDKVNKVVILVRDDGSNKTQIYPAVDQQPAWNDNIVSLGSSSSGDPTTESTPVSSYDDLVAALDNPEVSYILITSQEGLTISGTFSIDRDLTIDLNGKTLTIDKNASLVIQGNVTITDSLRSNIAIIDEVENEPSSGIIIDDTTSYEEDWDNMYTCTSIPGIKVESEGDTAGSLTLQNVDITGNRCTNIDNYGTLSLVNVKFTATGVPDCGGQGIWNKGTIANISGSTITVHCDYGIYNDGTITEISDTIFNVIGDNYFGFGRYGISNHGPATINSTTFNIYDGCYGFENYHSDPDKPEAVKISGGFFIAKGAGVVSIQNTGGRLVVANSTFKEPEEEEEEDTPVSYNGAPILVSGGEVRLDGVTVTVGEDASADCVSASSDSEVIIDSNPEITTDSFFNYKLACSDPAKYTIYGGTFGSKTFDELTTKAIRDEICAGAYNVIAMTEVDGETTQTTYTIINKKIELGSSIFGEEMAVDTGESITIDLSSAGAKLYKTITVNSGGKLIINNGNYCEVYDGSITVNAGGTLDHSGSKSFSIPITSNGGTVMMSDSELKKYLISVLGNDTDGFAPDISLVDVNGNTTTVSTDANTGEVTITLGSNLTLSSVTVNGNKNIILNNNTLTIEGPAQTPQNGGDGYGVKITNDSSLTVSGYVSDGVSGGNVHMIATGGGRGVTVDKGTMTLVNVTVTAENKGMYNVIYNGGRVIFNKCDIQVAEGVNFTNGGILDGNNIPITFE